MTRTTTRTSAFHLHSLPKPENDAAAAAIVSRFRSSSRLVLELPEQETTTTAAVDDHESVGVGVGVENDNTDNQRMTKTTRTASKSTSWSSVMTDIASRITLEKCQLLGVKSLGVDYGLARTGVAVTVGYNPEPLAILSSGYNGRQQQQQQQQQHLNNTNITEICHQVMQYAMAERVSKIIVGLPLHKNGSVAEQTNVTLVFAEQLAVACLRDLGPNVAVELWDERYSSKEAAARAHAKDPNRFLYGSLDADAACIILEHYYQDNGQGRIVVPVTDEALRRECLHHYQTKQSLEQERRRQALLEREQFMQRRKESIAKMQQEQKAKDLEQQNGNEKSKKKKKKKKRKK